MRQTHRIAPVIGLGAITAIWGWTFLVVKLAVASYPAFAFLGLRFGLATLLLAPVALRRLSWDTLASGALAGAALAAGYAFQTVGLETTSAANAGLLTGLFVVFAPLMDAAWSARPVPTVTVLAAGLGLAGTAMLTLGAGSSGLRHLHIGDALEVLTALAFALHIVLLGRLSRGRRAEQLAFVQMLLACCSFGLVATWNAGLSWPSPSNSVWYAILITGILASALAYWVQTYAQQHLAPARTAVLLLAEPVFALGFAVWLGGERLAPLQWLGAGIILGCLLMHEVLSVTASPPGRLSCIRQTREVGGYSGKGDDGRCRD